MKRKVCKKVVYTSGVFDLFHAGHLEALGWAKKHGDILIVGVLNDADAVSYKRAPIFSYEQRIAILRSISIVDRVIHGPKTETEEFYQSLNIDIHCQGDQLTDFYDTAKHLGILRILGRSKLTETSKIIEQIAQTYGRNSSTG